MGRQITMQVQQPHTSSQHSTNPNPVRKALKSKTTLRKKIAKQPRPVKMLVQQVANKIRKIKQNKPSTKTQSDINKLTIFNTLKKSLKSQNQKQKLSKGKKKRSMLRDKLAFKRQLDQTILGKTPIRATLTPQRLGHPQHKIGKNYSLGTEERTKQHSADINNMKQIMNNNGFQNNPLSSLKQHLLSKVPRKMETE